VLLSAKYEAGQVKPLQVQGAEQLPVQIPYATEEQDCVAHITAQNLFQALTRQKNSQYEDCCP
jgi:hypothetical protein